MSCVQHELARMVELDGVLEPLVPALAQALGVGGQRFLQRLRHVDGVERAVRRALGGGRHIAQAVARIGNGLRGPGHLLVEAQLAQAVAQLARELADAAQQFFGGVVRGFRG